MKPEQKRLHLTAFLLLALLMTLPQLSLYAIEDIIAIDEDPVTLLSPVIEAMGGADSALASGFSALFTNPAGLSRDGGELVLAGLTIAPYLLPSDEIIALFTQIVEGEDPVVLSDITDALASLDLEHGVGTNLNLSLGFGAFGLGAGALIDLDLFMRQQGASTSILVHPVLTLSAVTGLSQRYTLGESAVLHIGADVRGIVRMRPAVTITLSEVLGIVDDMISSESGDSGFDPNTYPIGVGVGIGCDAGIVLESEDMTYAVSLQNIGGTDLIYSEQTVATLNELFGSDDIIGALTSDPLQGFSFSIPMSVTFGIGFDPRFDLFSRPARLRFAAEYTHTFYQEEDSIEASSFWKNLHLGGEIDLLGILKVRGGVNQGYFTWGAGIDLLFVRIDCTYYSRELGLYAGHIQNQAIALSVRAGL